MTDGCIEVPETFDSDNTTNYYRELALSQAIRYLKYEDNFSLDSTLKTAEAFYQFLIKE